MRPTPPTDPTAQAAAFLESSLAARTTELRLAATDRATRRGLHADDVSLLALADLEIFIAVPALHGRAAGLRLHLEVEEFLMPTGARRGRHEHTTVIGVVQAIHAHLPVFVLMTLMHAAMGGSHERGVVPTRYDELRAQAVLDAMGDAARTLLWRERYSPRHNAEPVAWADESPATQRRAYAAVLAQLTPTDTPPWFLEPATAYLRVLENAPGAHDAEVPVMTARREDETTVEAAPTTAPPTLRLLR